VELAVSEVRRQRILPLLKVCLPMRPGGEVAPGTAEGQVFLACVVNKELVVKHDERPSLLA
jgi:hypothetical protein